MNKSLSSVIEINSRFIRSVRLDADYGRTDVLDTFVLQPSAASALEILARHINQTQQRAFTWTGPYGGGKSSLALALCSLVHANPKVRGAARKALLAERGTALFRAFDGGAAGDWTVLPIVGKRSSVSAEIARAITRVQKSKRGKPPGGDVIAELVRLAESPNTRGVLLVVDEMGKFLEHSAQQGTDVYFYQELAEAAARAKGKLVVIGILHQSFDQYAVRLGRDLRDEWSKVQGRFVDTSLATGSDEQIDLIGKAISSKAVRHQETFDQAAVIAKSIGQHRAVTAKNLASRLDNCWPLHPVTAALLGPSSRRRFSQNERSIFGFLNSVEPFGFREFLEGTPAKRYAYYSPAQFWDYLRSNFEPGILASTDGHRWSLGLEAVERAEAKGTLLHVQLVKTIALIEMLRNGSGLTPEPVVLAACFPEETPRTIDSALRALSDWSIIIYRKHLSAWGIYAGSDFDIEAALVKARAEISTQDLCSVTESIELPPILAKRVYQETGAMHFLTRNIIAPDAAESYIRNFKAKAGSCGEFLLVLSQRGGSPEETSKLAQRLSLERDGELLIGVPEHGAQITELAEDLLALQHVYTSSTELDSDRVAAREVNARIELLRTELDELLRDAFLAAQWYWRGKLALVPCSQSLSALASSVVKKRYGKAPILLSELINRESPSSNSVKARRDLMYRMLANRAEERLGYTGYSADVGLYFTILHSTTLHRLENEVWGFHAPKPLGRGLSFEALWAATNSRVLTKNSSISLVELYRMWSARPFGMRAGVRPVIALAYFLCNEQSLALYQDGFFVPELTPLHIDEWLQDPSRIEWRFVEATVSEKDTLDSLAQFLSDRLGRRVPAECLDVSRGLVSIVVNLPGWTKRTAALSDRTRTVRQILAKANDPHRLIFVDLAAVFGGLPNLTTGLVRSILELSGAFGRQLLEVEAKLFKALSHSADVDELNERGRVVAGISGDFRLDAFATRLATYRSRERDLESLIGLAVNKPARDWVDRDIEAAVLQFGEWSLAFRRVEALAPLRNRPATRHAIAVIFGPADGSRTLSRIIEVSVQERKRASLLAQQILSMSESQKREVLLAALAEAGASLVAELGGKED